MFTKRALLPLAIFAALTVFSSASPFPAQGIQASDDRSRSSGNSSGGTGKKAPDASSTTEKGEKKPAKSYAFYVGANKTEDGSVLLGGTGEEPSSHWLDIVPHRQHPSDATITVGVTEEATIPGELMEIPQAEKTAKYITMRYSEFAGFPPPLTNGGLNEHQVAVRDVWSPSREELVEMTPTPQRGLNYSDLARIVMQRARTAREGAELIGTLIERHGYATYGGNTHIIADSTEGWIVKEMAGGQGLWVAERLGPDEIRVSYPGYIGTIPENFERNPNYMGSDNLVSFAAEQGWYNPDSGNRFDVHEVYGAQDLDLETGPKLMSPVEIERELEALAPVSVDEMMAMVRDPRIADDDAGYGQVAHLRKNLPNKELALLWVAPTGSVAAPFIPWRIGVRKVPPEFRQHRYLTGDAAATYLNEDYQLQEATRNAFRVFKRLMYYTCAHPEEFLPEVTRTLEAFEKGMLDEQDAVQSAALALYESGQEKSARRYLTSYSRTQALKGLRLGADLAKGIGARTRVLYDIPEPSDNKEINASSSSSDPSSVHCLVNADPDLAGDPPEGAVPEAGELDRKPR